MRTSSREFEVIVIGGGHAGVEAAWAAANMGADVALVTLDPDKIGVMSCNPAIGGLAKGQMVREVDALGGLMGEVTDATGIMFKIINESRGAAVRSPRAQCDKLAYAREVQRRIAARAQITVIGASAESFIVETGASDPRCVGVKLGRTTDPAWDGAVLRAGAVVLTTGTFMRGLMHTGETKTEGGRSGEAPAVGISATLRELGFELGRLKTGTPPRLRRSTIDWEALEPQHGDDPPTPFSDLTDRAAFPRLEQLECRLTSTSHEAHELIRANIHRAPMFSGQIDSVGPRYCPSIEDKVVRFADRDAHQVFLEPESHESDWVYCNGIATSLPKDVQDGIVRAMPGCERAEILLHGYAVEYDMVLPHQIHATAMTKRLPGLFLAGQINGTSGYEEAAGQGLVAGANAVRFARDQGEFLLGRDQAYIGVMMDDLVTKTPTEPYRMFTSRAEHRLLLRADNASDRLTPLAHDIGLASDARMDAHKRRETALDSLRGFVRTIRVDGEPLEKPMSRPGFDERAFREIIEENGRAYDPGVLRTALAEHQYAGYIDRQQREVRRMVKMERRTLPGSLDYASVQGLRKEAREVLASFRPSTLGQASRLAGVNPADLTILVVHMDRELNARRDRATTRPHRRDTRSQAEPHAGTSK